MLKKMREKQFTEFSICEYIVFVALAAVVFILPTVIIFTALDAAFGRSQYPYALHIILGLGFVAALGSFMYVMTEKK